MAGYPDQDVITTLVAGHYADPFSLLGMHQTEAGLVVRALLPDASAVSVIEAKNGRRVTDLNCDDPRGCFSALIPRRKNPFHYRLAVTWHEHTYLIEDPYRFGPLLQDIDSWLLAEGTHLRPWERLGAHPEVLDDVVAGMRFAVWAPNARRVSVVGEFNF